MKISHQTTAAVYPKVIVTLLGIAKSDKAYFQLLNLTQTYFQKVPNTYLQWL